LNVLETIAQRKRAEIARNKGRLPPDDLARLAQVATPVRGFKRALSGDDVPLVIAEVKRASPSKGVLRPDISPVDWSPEELAKAYARGGACCLSVLTDSRHFWGHPDYVEACREATALPVLRKEFIIDPYQVDESRSLGADAVLLITALLDDYTLSACYDRARELEMDVLVEIHADAELDRALPLEDALIGINHRDLRTLQMDMQRVEQLAPRIPDGRMVVAESGVSKPEVIQQLMQRSVLRFLIGSHLASATDPTAELQRLRKK